MSGIGGYIIAALVGAVLWVVGGAVLNRREKINDAVSAVPWHEKQLNNVSQTIDHLFGKHADILRQFNGHEKATSELLGDFSRKLTQLEQECDAQAGRVGSALGAVHARLNTLELKVEKLHRGVRGAYARANKR